ncbi:MAG TPA: methyltransferase [Opitutae bacterium]|nr:methyltransferase [Opitutae bacterium]|tara:strand:+ start:8682 stop:9419 length:738 start_codon:yes stop_codon:yes gene_type:complete
MTLPPLTRWKNSISKRLCWKAHLSDAVSNIQSSFKEISTLEAMLAVPLQYRGKGYYNTLDLKQNFREILGLVQVLEQYPLKRICEIGTNKGGTLFIWCQLAAINAKIISIDLPGGAFGGGYTKRSIPFFESFCKDSQELTCLRLNSHDSATRDRLENVLEGDLLDFLFIDGDHSYEGVKSDFTIYSKLVRPGGIIGFHDIIERPEHPSIEVHRFWEELKKHYRHHEFIDSSGQSRKIGIGIVYVN